MKTGFFIGMPSHSVHTTLFPIGDVAAVRGYKIYYFNTPEFLSLTANSKVTGIPYPTNYRGYDMRNVTTQTNYFDFANLLLDTAESLMSFLVDQAAKLKPDFVMYSHLAMAGKLLARHSKIPAITLFSTAVLDRRVIHPYMGSEHHIQNFDNIKKAIAFKRKAESLHQYLGLNQSCDIWDAYVNEGDFNICLIPAVFQPNISLFGDNFEFINPCRPKPHDYGRKKLIYVSMGTVFNKDRSVFEVCIRALANFPMEVVISDGSTMFDRTLPNNIRRFDFVDQLEILDRTKIFISRGGMASLREALNAGTPIIVLPEIPEQVLNGVQIERLGIGLSIISSALTIESLQNAVNDILQNYERYINNIRSIQSEFPNTSLYVNTVRALDTALKL